MEIVVVLLSHAPALGPVAGRGSVAARAFPSSADWREQEGDGGGLCPSLAVVDCCQPPVHLRKWFSKSFVGILQGSLPLLLSCLGHGCRLDLH